MMTGIQVAALFFSPAFAIFGVCFIVFHQHISDMARLFRKERGAYVGAQTQSPGLMIVVGLFMLMVSVAIVLYAFTGILGDHSQI
ncbi:hypothetical protein FRIG_10400 [Frigoribacterium faeni]|uniref:hypothetical protein n=2 Tax=Frigoribacterium TaxID=96492 RepID=UPI001FACEB4E|nr:hypothetical protein [Frigoribacterium faeni]MCJ0701536.1 hypothetical protein [Frigoribacterium faeni]